MPRVCVVGSGYVGTVVAACLAEVGHDVVALEADPAKRASLRAGDVPFHEPGLPELLRSTLASGRLTFAEDAVDAMDRSDVVFLCVGTPSGADGHADLSALAEALGTIGPAVRHPHVFVTKSTVPIGTHGWLATMLDQAIEPGDGLRYSVVSNPEFLREGSAVVDYLFPDRVVLGSDDERALDAVVEVYRPILERTFTPSVDIPLGVVRDSTADLPALLRTTLATAETIKYAANAFLATKISFANEMAGICDRVGADVTEVMAGIGMDRRIGGHFLNAGVGWGGSCFGKDVSALMATARDFGFPTRILDAVVEVNESQRAVAVEKLQRHLHTLSGRRITLLGLAFKPGTDDLRDAPSLDIGRRLADLGAVVRGHDPVVTEVPAWSGITVGLDMYEAAAGADAVVLVTEWPDYAVLDLEKLAGLMRGRVLLDGRNALDRAQVEAAGLVYEGIGRSAAIAGPARGWLGV